MKKAGFVCCSNGLDKSVSSEIFELTMILAQMGVQVVPGQCLYKKNSIYSGSGRERAEDLMRFFSDPEIDYIFDLSGGDIANEVLPYLDYEVIRNSKAVFMGYSDLTTIINAIYAKTGKASGLYQIRNLVREEGELQQDRFYASINYNYDDSDLELDLDFNFDVSGINNEKSLEPTPYPEEDPLYAFPFEWVQGNTMEGIVVGGNIRCLLKLAGTPYFPDLTGKVLLLEAMSGTVAQLTTYFSQLWQMGAFDQVSGIILGTFTQMEREMIKPDVMTILKNYVSEDMPIAKSPMIGHGADSCAVMIGSYLFME